MGGRPRGSRAHRMVRIDGTTTTTKPTTTRSAEVVDAFREVCDAYLECASHWVQTTDENTRFFAVPSTGAAMLLAHHVNRSNTGLTLDIVHMIMAARTLRRASPWWVARRSSSACSSTTATRSLARGWADVRWSAADGA